MGVSWVGPVRAIFKKLSDSLEFLLLDFIEHLLCAEYYLCVGRPGQLYLASELLVDPFLVSDALPFVLESGS